MGDEEHGKVLAVVDLLEEIEDLRSHGHVQSAGRLVRDDQFRVDHEGGTDTDTLALSAREFPGKTVGIGSVQPDQFQHLDGLFAAGLGRADPVRQKRLFQGRGDRPSGIQRTERVLKNRLHTAGELEPAFAGVFHSVDPDLPLEGNQSQHGLSERGLSASALSHQTENFIAMDRQTHVIEDAGHF